MGEAGREHALREFSIDVTLPALEAEFQRQPAKAEAPRPALIGTYYDLSAAGHNWLLPTEMPALQDLRCQTWLAGEGVHPKVADALAPHTKNAFWIPDMGVLNMEWQARTDEQARLNAMRKSINRVVSEEEFASAARIALWISVQSQRLGLPQRWYVPTENEVLVLWLVHELTGVPVILSQSLLPNWPVGEACELLPRRPRGLTSHPRRGVARLMPWLRPWQTKRWQASLRTALEKL
jgi:hypothetical protein